MIRRVLLGVCLLAAGWLAVLWMRAWAQYNEDERIMDALMEARWARETEDEYT